MAIFGLSIKLIVVQSFLMRFHKSLPFAISRIVRPCLLLFSLLLSSFSFAQKEIQLKSPNGNITFSFNLTREVPTYKVIYKGTELIGESTLALDFKEGGTFGEKLRMGTPTYWNAEENYDLVVGKTKYVFSYSKAISIPLMERSGAGRQVDLVVRVFNEGVAFRYEFPPQSNWASYEMTEERSTFNIKGNPKIRAMLLGTYTSSHEGYYRKMPLSEVKNDTLMDMPALFEFPNNVYMAITEANLRNYAGMYLRKKEGYLVTQLSPLPGQTEIKVKANLPHKSPWRVMMISNRIGDLMESNMITALADSKIKMDFSWLKPGKTSFHWWNGDITPDTTFAPGINFATNKYYIDFCADNGIEYHSVIGYGGFPWYVSDAAGYGAVGKNTDVTRTVPTLDMQQVCDYAKQRGVGIHVWVHWNALYRQLEEAFTQFEKWGVKGMMVDFMNRDDQEMVNIQEEILQAAARHKLFIQFHGSFKPTGLSRTFPNELTREGTLNYEINKFRSQGLDADHDLDMPFTRGLAGSTDYHLGGFRAVPSGEFKRQYTRPLMAGTRAHMLAMYVVLESYLAMVADYPEAYLKQPGFEFLQKVPTTWDETRVPLAEVGQFATTARRKGTDWYMGTINSTTARKINIPLAFLGKGKYHATIYSDAKDVATHPNHLDKVEKVVSATDSMEAILAASGGHVVHFAKVAE